MAAGMHRAPKQLLEKTMTQLQQGDFVRVRLSSEFRPGQDGMVVSDDNGVTVGLVFGCDRCNRHPSEIGVNCTDLAEEWLLAELDLSSVEH